jgi:UDP-N-acetylglucosamine 1-carboxyvinyltransferase
MPGGCAIGARPIDQHLKGLKAMGAEITLTEGYVEATAKQLRGATIYFDMVTVTGTENVMMAAVLAKGRSVLENCAREPEIEELARVLNKMGARIEGAGTERILIEGVDELSGAQHRVRPDRIVAGTFVLAGAIAGEDVTVTDCEPDDLVALLDVLRGVGVVVETGERHVRIQRNGPRRAIGVQTAPFPGFATDLQAQYMALATQVEGRTLIEETIFENRFMHVAELHRMGADIRVAGGSAEIHGPTRLSGAQVMATDLRASACLVLAALAAEGETVVGRVYHLDRGYQRIEEKLRGLGADVERFDTEAGR